MNLKQTLVTLITISLAILFNFGAIEMLNNSNTNSEIISLIVLGTNILIYLIYRFEIKIRE